MAKSLASVKSIVKSANTTGITLLKNNFVEDCDQGVAIYVQPPSRRIVNINSNGSNDYDDYDDYSDNYDSDPGEYHTYSGNFFLSFPHVVFRMAYTRHRQGDYTRRRYVYKPNSLRVAFASQAKPTKLFIPPLFNLSENLQVCVGMPNKFFNTLEECMKAVVVEFWKTKFEDSMYDAYGANYERRSLMGDPRKWQKKTKKQPGWIPNGRSMKEFHLRLGKFASVTHLREGYDDEDFDPDGY